ncbi:MAG: molecular chaperone DnaK [Desulfuromonas sp.]|nr:MAG: molecular chaperone DnaK [Desulfuromonas sp.]
MEALTQRQLAELQQDLIGLQGELLALLDMSSESSRPVELDQPIGRLSRMDALQQQHMAKANRQGHEQRLRLVENALGAIRNDRYGECRSCEEPVGYPRLKARPETPFCLACQEEREEAR